MKKNWLILILIIIALAGFGIGFATGDKLPGLQTGKLPLPADFLSNPVIEKAYANVEGKVIARSKDSFSLEKNGQQVQIFVEESVNLTTFKEKVATGEAEVHFAEINNGDFIKGGISVVINPSSTVGLSKPKKSGDIIGQRFTVIRKINK